MTRNVILDWSGTLVDDFEAVFASSNAVFAQCGHPIFAREDFRRAFRLPYQDFYAEFLPLRPMAEIDAMFHADFGPRQAAIALLPGAKEFLERAKETGRRLFLLSTIHPDHFAAQAERLGVHPAFEEACIGVRDKRAVIRELLERRNLRAEETVFIGDMAHDLEAARAGGVRAVAVLSGFDPAEKLLAAAPDLVAPGLGALTDVLMPRAALLHPLPVSTVGALIVNLAGDVLMLRTHKWSNLWGIPGGKIQRGEAAAEAIRREVQEETSLMPERVEFALVQDCIDSPEFMAPAHFLLLNYVAWTGADTRVVLNEEAHDFRWLAPADALDLDLNTPSRVLLEWAIERGWVK